MSGQASSHSWSEASDIDWSGLNDYVSKTSEGAKYQSLYENMQNTGTKFFKDSGGAGYAIFGPGGRGATGQNTDSATQNQFASDYIAWKAQQDSQNTLWSKYSSLAKDQMGRDATILTGPESTDAMTALMAAGRRL